MSRRYLVTGAAGFIGFRLAERLSETGAEVVAVDDFSRGARDAAYEALVARPNVSELVLDLASADAVARLPQGPFDVVYHLAALNGTQNFYERPYEVARSSTLPTFALFERYGRHGRMGRFVYAGSSEAYACTVTRFDWPVPTDESVPLSIDDPTNLRWSYGASKLHGEVVSVAGAAQFGVPYTVIRYHNVYGPRMGDKHVIPDFVGRMARGEYVLLGHEDTRSFLYVDDAVDATMRLGESDAAKNQIVNVGSERELTIRELGELMLRAAGVEADIDLQPSPKGSVRRRAPDLRRLREMIDFAPRWSLEEGVERTVRWYLDQAGPNA